MRPGRGWRWRGRRGPLSRLRERAGVRAVAPHPALRATFSRTREKGLSACLGRHCTLWGYGDTALFLGWTDVIHIALSPPSRRVPSRSRCGHAMTPKPLILARRRQSGRVQEIGEVLSGRMGSHPDDRVPNPCRPACLPRPGIDAPTPALPSARRPIRQHLDAHVERVYAGRTA